MTQHGIRAAKSEIARLPQFQTPSCLLRASTSEMFEPLAHFSCPLSAPTLDPSNFPHLEFLGLKPIHPSQTAAVLVVFRHVCLRYRKRHDFRHDSRYGEGS